MDQSAELAYQEPTIEEPIEQPTGLGLVQATVHQRELMIEELCQAILRKAGSAQANAQANAETR
jgi:hypothetical protein